MHYFGPWSDPDGALAKYLEQKDALHAGRKPRESSAGATVKDAANTFLNHKQARLDAGELSPRTFAEYSETCDLIVSEFGKRRLLDDIDAADFAALRTRWRSGGGRFASATRSSGSAPSSNTPSTPVSPNGRCGSDPA